MKLYSKIYRSVWLLPSLITTSLIMSGCEQSAHYQLDWQIALDQQPLTCASSNGKNGQNQSDSDQPQLDWFLMLIHDVKVKVGERWESVSVEKPDDHSSEVFLAGRVCIAGQKAAHYPLKFSAPDNISELQFTIGVPFNLNHQNPLQQQAPLNRPDMFWVWRNGHKFLRLETKTEAHTLTYHLGSTGCESASAMRPPAERCANPNLVQINLPVNQLSRRSVIEFNLNQFIQPANKESESLATEIHCLSSPDNSACDILYGRLASSFNVKALD